MKTKILGLLLFISLIILSCKKECTKSVAGKWVGTYSINEFPKNGDLPYTITLNADGSLLTEGTGSDGATYHSKGTWTLAGEILNCSLTSIDFPVTVSQSAQFTYSSANQLTSGIWKDISNSSGATLFSGKFSTMNRSN